MSLRAKVTLAFTAVLAVVLAAAGAFLYVRYREELRDTQDRALRSRAAQLVDAAEGGRLGPRLPDAPGVEADEDVAQIVEAHGDVIAGNAAARRPLLTPAQIAAARRTARFFDRPGDAALDEDVRLLAQPVRIGASGDAAARGAGNGVAVVGASADEVDEAAATLLLLEAVALGVALSAGAAGAWLLAGAVVRPVRAALEREQRFVADASHELRTPLTVLKSELEVTRLEGGDADALRAALASAEEEVDRLSRLADDLLVLAQTDDQRLALRLTEVDVDVLLARAARGRDGVERRPSGLRVRADELRLEQAVGNLVDNAVRHGAAPVVLGAERRGGDVVISVRDHGPGLPPGVGARALERFARAPAGRGGAGLGLAIVDAIAHAHGGSVRLVEAQPGLLAELCLPHRPLTTRDAP